MNEPAHTTPATAEQQAGGGRIFTSYLFRSRNGSDVVFSDEPPPPPPEVVRRPARVALMLALAHRFQRAIERGDYADRADLARQFGLTRARITQLLNLTLLAPDIQEEVLKLEAVDGVQPTSERALREVVGEVEWGEQRLRWTALQPGAKGPHSSRRRRCSSVQQRTDVADWTSMDYSAPSSAAGAEDH